MKTIAYIRVSTVKQLDGAGPQQQRNSITEWAVSHGARIDEFAIDSESGDVEDRTEIMRLKEMAAAGVLGVLVFDRMDRLARDAYVSETLYRYFVKHGVKVICVQQTIEDSPIGNVIRQVIAAIAQFDKAQRLAHLKACRKATVARKGTFSGGRPPLGYTSAGGGLLQIDPITAKLVRRVFELRDAGVSSLTDIAAAVTREGFRTSNGRRIEPMQVSRILKREAVYRAQRVITNVVLEAQTTPQQPAVLK